MPLDSPRSPLAPAGRALAAASPPALDLLASPPAARPELAALRDTVAFAFATGVHDGALATVLRRRELPASGWDPACFADDLFLPELVARCMVPAAGGARARFDEVLLARVLAHPPAEPAPRELRRGVVRELLAAPSLRADLERAWQAIRELHRELETPLRGRSAESLARRLAILASARAAFDALASGFEGATSALATLRAFGAAARAGEGYRRLAEVLDYDEHLATIEVRVRFGGDGAVRSLAIVDAKENVASPLHVPLVTRVVRRLLAALRGQRFTEQELLARAIEAVYDAIEPELVALVALAPDLEAYLATLAFHDRAARRGLATCLPEIADAGDREAVALFNPLLAAGDGPVVPCDVALSAGDAVVVLTGPNSGGKTRLLQTLAATQMLGEGGFLVPAARARLVRASSLFVSLTVPASADQGEGRLGTELLRIRSLFERVAPGALVILDELCSGTNPSEGEEMFQLVAELLAELAPQAFVSTHFLDLAARLEREGGAHGMRFLQVDLDDRQCPTYQFVPGVARTSLAQRTAARLGVTRDELRALVRRSRRGRAARR